MTNKNILVKVGLLLGAVVLFSSFKKKGVTKSGIPLISQLDAPTGTQQVYSKVGTILFDLNKNTVKTFNVEGYGMTVTGFNNGVYSVVYGDSFISGLPAYVNSNDVIS
jgi:hypothetical protein